MREQERLEKDYTRERERERERQRQRQRQRQRDRETERERERHTHTHIHTHTHTPNEPTSFLFHLQGYFLTYSPGGKQSKTNIISERETDAETEILRE